MVAALFVVLQLAFVVVHLHLGWDETVYISQVDPRHPAAFFSAPRSRGISLLVAPVLAVTGSTIVLRVVLALASAVALWAAFRVWQPILGRVAVALAALMFATLWVTVLYGPEVMPNLWVALVAVAAVGWFLRAVAPNASRRAPVAMAGCVAAATLVRFSDGVWLAAALVVAAVLVRAWRRPIPVVAVVVGLALGSAQWVVEAYVRWGGVTGRLVASGSAEGGMWPHWNVGNAWRGLSGPLLCRPCTSAPPPVGHTLWWLALPPLAVAASVVAVRVRKPAATLLPVACATALAVPYLLLLNYSAPRFLLPAYALLSLPLATLAIRVVRSVRTDTARTIAVAGLVTLFAAHLSTQYADLRDNLLGTEANTARYATVADALHRLGLRAPCLVTGTKAPPIAYYAGCASADVSGNNRDITVAAVERRAADEPTAALAKTADGPPPYARTWTATRIAGTGLTAYMPGRRASGSVGDNRSRRPSPRR
ncbi:hypothetical protein [Stackebrandtia sp.]|uniref:hypothetical protein n=1 Tax=Stackebrandtia sp. TaxID=2023065 RepID=UPI002D77E0CE|nr:hypothetical protein [Stackebrandtia sp.]